MDRGVVGLFMTASLDLNSDTVSVIGPQKRREGIAIFSERRSKSRRCAPGFLA